MAMKNTGFVTEVLKDTVKVRVVRESACGGNCAGCHGCPSDAVIIECKKDGVTEFGVGDAVTVEMPNSSFFGGVLISYGLMTFTMIIGAIAGYVIFKNEIASVLGGFLGLTVGIALMKVLAKKQKIEITIKRK